MATEIKNVFDAANPDKKLSSLNDLNQAYMLAYLDYQMKKDADGRKAVEKYAAASQGKSLKEKKRLFALDFMPDLLKDNKKTFEEKLAAMLSK